MTLYQFIWVAIFCFVTRKISIHLQNSAKMSWCPNGRFLCTYFLPLCASSPCVSEGGQRFCSNSYSDHSQAFLRCDCACVLSGHQLEYLNICNDHIWKVSLQNVSLRGSWGCQLVWRIFHIECSGKVDLLNEFSCALWDFHLLCRSTQVFLEGTILCAGVVTLSTFEKLFSWMSSNVLLHVTSLYTQVITLRAFKRLFTWMLVFPETIKCGASVATLFAFESLFSWMCPQLMWF